MWCKVIAIIPLAFAQALFSNPFYLLKEGLNSPDHEAIFLLGTPQVGLSPERDVLQKKMGTATR